LFYTFPSGDQDNINPSAALGLYLLLAKLALNLLCELTASPVT